MDSATQNLTGGIPSPSQTTSTHPGWPQTLAGILPFLVLTPATLFYMLDREGGFFIFVLAYLVLLVGLGVGWVQGFPPWSYPYAGLVLALTFVLVSQHDSEESFLVNLVFSLLFSLPFILLVLVAMLVSRTERSLGRFARKIRRDWTLLSFLFYGATPLVLMVAFIQVEFSFGISFLVGATLALLAGALAYLNANKTWWRWASLAIGLTIAWGIATAGGVTYWNGRFQNWLGTQADASAILRDSLIAWILFLGLTLAPGLLHLLPTLRPTRPPSP